MPAYAIESKFTPFHGGWRMKKPNSSMQLTRAADYGVRVMIHLAGKQAGERVSLPELAQAANAPESFLSKVLQALTRAGLVISRRGQAGGFAISARGGDATIRDIIEAVEGPIRLNVCLVEGCSCSRKSWCTAHPVWAQAQQAMFEVLDRTTVTEMAGSAFPARKAMFGAYPVRLAAKAGE